MKTEDADAKSDSSSVCSDGWVLENETVESSSPSDSVVQEAPIETSNSPVSYSHKLIIKYVVSGGKIRILGKISFYIDRSRISSSC